MDVRTPRSLRFESLETRICLSAAHPGAAHPGVLKGTIDIPLPADTSSLNQLSFDGNGTMTPLGPVSALGTLNSSADLGGGGVIDLAGGDGGLVLNVNLTSPHGGAGRPRIRFTIIGGTGTYTNASGQGTAAIGTSTRSNEAVLELHGTVHTGS